MINYTCDLCRSECNEKTFALPIAATWVDGDPFDLMPINMNLCRHCRTEIYKTIETLTTKENIHKLNRLALNTKMRKCIDE